MTPQQLVGLGVRIFAIWLAFTCFYYLVRLPVFLDSIDLSNKSVAAYVIGATYAVSALLLWLFPMWAAHKLLPRTSFNNVINLQPFEVARVGCALIGLWFFAQGFLDTVWFLFRAFLVRGSQSLFANLDVDARLNFAFAVISLILGLTLILRAGRFASLVMRGAPNLENSN